MGYKKETTEDDLIMLPDIDGMIKDIKKRCPSLLRKLE